MHTRYTLEGNEETTDSSWGNFQIDGYGTWLWALAEHIGQTGNYDLLNEFSHSIETTIRYLLASWRLPNYDCWEEHPDYLHPYSLAAVCGGLQAINRLITARKTFAGILPVASGVAEIKDFLTKNAVFEDKFVKHIWPTSEKQQARPLTTSGVDSSLLGLGLPYDVFPLDHPVLANTVAAIESELHRPEGGVYRYKGDVYYGVENGCCFQPGWAGITRKQSGYVQSKNCCTGLKPVLTNTERWPNRFTIICLPLNTIPPGLTNGGQSPSRCSGRMQCTSSCTRHCRGCNCR